MAKISLGIKSVRRLPKLRKLNLLEADKLEVTVLVDNYTDLLLLQNSEVLKRPGFILPKVLLAEHGLSCLIKVYAGSEEHTVLMDAGILSTTLLHNANVLKIDLNKVESVILSHGHFDHFGGLLGFLNKGKKGLPLILHPDAFGQRRLNLPTLGVQVDLPSLDGIALEKAGAVVHKTKDPFKLFSDLILILGEVDRVTDFEKGFPGAERKIDGQWVVDPIHDDQGVAIKVKGRGLIVIGGCSHSGIINTIRHAQKVAKEEKVHAVLGGFHLSGPFFEPIIMPTIEEMKKISPDFIVPMHCTGWEAINQFAKEMPKQFLLNTVGTTYVFQ